MQTIVEYKTPQTGLVRLGALYAQELLNYARFNHPVLAGYFRNKHEDKVPPIVVTSDVAERIVAAKDYPLDFDQRAAYLLRFIYEHGGKEYERRDIQCSRDYPICYAQNDDELMRLTTSLIEQGLIKVGKVHMLTSSSKSFLDVILTQAGLAKISGEMPKEQLSGLIRGKIQTGQPDLDDRINHAYELFNSANGDMEGLRSACIALAAVLERYRDDLAIAFVKKDTDTFFALVNEFDIRHNKTRVQQIEHPEQLEWVYYPLLNSISTYCKLKARDAR
jgi:hypothetical protein